MLQAALLLIVLGIVLCVLFAGVLNTLGTLAIIVGLAVGVYALIVGNRNRV